jgi:hypothetical protein
MKNHDYGPNAPTIEAGYHVLLLGQSDLDPYLFLQPNGKYITIKILIEGINSNRAEFDQIANQAASSFDIRATSIEDPNGEVNSVQIIIWLADIISYAIEYGYLQDDGVVSAGMSSAGCVTLFGNIPPWCKCCRDEHARDAKNADPTRD